MTQPPTPEHFWLPAPATSDVLLTEAGPVVTNYFTTDQVRSILLAFSEAQKGESVAWLRDQRGEFSGRATLDPLFLLGPLDPGTGIHGGTYKPLTYANQPSVKAEDKVDAELLEALRFARRELAGLPHSLGYEFTHLPRIDVVLGKYKAIAATKDST